MDNNKGYLVQLIKQIVHPYFANEIADILVAHGVTIPQWISAKERLPEDLPENNGRKVIPCIVALQSCYPNGKATIQKRQRQVTYDYDHNPNGWEWSRIGKSRVTHWMPMPEPPKGEQT